jgi:hypothetical protein
MDAFTQLYGGCKGVLGKDLVIPPCASPPVVVSCVLNYKERCISETAQALVFMLGVLLNEGFCIDIAHFRPCHSELKGFKNLSMPKASYCMGR